MIYENDFQNTIRDKTPLQSLIGRGNSFTTRLISIVTMRKGEKNILKQAKEQDY